VYIGILLEVHCILHISRIRVNDLKQWVGIGTTVILIYCHGAAIGAAVPRTNIANLCDSIT
jgi:hypothetical protein